MVEFFFQALPCRMLHQMSHQSNTLVGKRQQAGACGDEGGSTIQADRLAVMT
jgi:hypothetical protein